MNKLKIWLGISLVLLGLMIIFCRPQYQPRIIFCDVGQGDGAIVTIGNWQMVVDTGPDNGQMERCLSKYLPFWDRQLEIVTITHWDSDHSGGLQKLSTIYKINSLYANKASEDQIEQKLYPVYLREGDVIGTEMIYFEILSPTEISETENQDSIIGILNYGTKKILMMADATAEVEQKLAWREKISKVDMIKISHHGSATATSQELLEVARPERAIISVGKNNKFGHPTKAVLEKLEKMKIEILRTDEIGDIEIKL